MKNLLRLSFLTALSISFVSSFAQTVTKTWTSQPNSTSVDGVGNYGTNLPSVSFAPGDFTDGCVVTDVDVTIRWAKTAGTCGSPTGGNSQHQETSFRIQSPNAGTENLALPGTWSGSATTGAVITTFSSGNPIPSGTPQTGTFGPNNGNLANFNGQDPFGAWTLQAGDNSAGAPLCVDYYQVTVTTAPDNTPPTINAVSDITVDADAGECNTTVTFTAPTASDNCSVQGVTQIAGSSSGSIFPVGTTTITYEASDPYGNTATTSFDVIVEDAEDPVISCPSTVSAGCDPVVNYPLPTATDNCSGVTVNLVTGPASGDTFPTGTTTVTYEAEDASGNTASCSFDVVVDTESTDPTSITASLSNVCAGDPTTLTVNGGSLGTNAQWLWYVGSCGGQLVGAGSSVVVNPLTTTTYYVRAESQCNVTDCAELLIEVTPAPSVGFSGINSPSGCGAADGVIIAVANGGTAPYTYTWSNNVVNDTLTGLSAGPYQVIVEDANGCSAQSSVSLNDPGASVVTLTSSDADNVICEGEAVTFTASGSFQYQYYVDGNPVTTQNPWTTTSLQDGETVSVVGTDFNFCSFTTSGIQFTVNDNPDVVETITDPSACGVSDGSITTAVSGGLPPYGYDWNNGETTSGISGLPAGPYFITVSDANGCETSETYALNDPGAAPVTMTSSEDPNNEICEGESVTFTASGSVDYEFFIDGQSVSTTNPYVTSGLVDGDQVVVTGTDGSNCTATSNVIIPTVNPGPTVTLTSNDPDTTICVGEDISFFASGANTYEFFVDGVSQGPASSTTVFVTSNLTDGQQVSVVGTDANLCDVSSDTMTVTVSPSPTVVITNSSNPSSCGATDGAISAEASGGTPGYTYTWSNGDTGANINFLNAGNYFVQVEDDAGCTAATSQSLSDVGSTPTTMTSSATNSTICGGETVTFTASGSSTYVFFVNGVQASTQNPYVTDSLMDGDIVAVLGLDTQLCASTSAPETFVVHPGIDVGVISSINPTACGAADGVANAIVVGGVPPYTYEWTPGGQTTPSATGLTAGPYSIEVEDANGCTSIDGVSLSDPGSFVVGIQASPAGQEICDGTEVEFTATGASTYQFYTDGTPVSSTNPYITSSIQDGQTIAVTGTDANNCTSTSPSLTYTVNPVPTASLTLPNSVCSSVDTIQLSGGSPLGGSYTVVYNGNPTTGNLFFPSVAGAGPINVDYTVTASNGCATTVSEDYNVLQAPEPDLGNDTTVCGITLDAGPGLSYEWQPSGLTDQTIDVSQTNVVSVTVTDANGCVGTDEVGITINPIPDPVVTPGTFVEFCVGESVTLSAQAGFDSYSWTTGSSEDTTFVNQSDTVVLTVTNSFGCEGTAEVVAVMNEPMPGAEITWDGPLEFCKGESVTLDAGPGYFSYQWNTGSTTQTIQAIESGDYTVVVLDGNGCIDSSMTSDPVTVNVWEPQPAVVQMGDSLVVTDASNYTDFQWYYNGDPISGETLPAHIIRESGNFYVCVTDQNGCEGCSPVFEMTCCVGIEEAFFNGEVSVYPNPNNGQFTLEVEMQEAADMTIGLYDMVGKQVWIDQGVGRVSNLRKEYDLSELPDGVYFIRIMADDQMTVQKLIKQQ